MSLNPFRLTAPTLRAYVIRVSASHGTTSAVSRLAVLAPGSGEAMAAVLAGLNLCDVAELTDEVLAPSEAMRLGLQPGQPLRLS